ncbi:MAG TPA: class I SAM-dependent methyltransferase [Candidatus Kapabacteria bacterium]|nr:class I SAM-dependent methyltransferase [Candidatus Kapabacteria bacterium]
MKYDETFFQAQKNGVISSAKEIVPMVMDLIDPQKVVDVGCGIGAWLSIFKESGVKEIFGVDGSWVRKEDLLIDGNNFQFADLEEPLCVDKKFDLAVSLEVAEHISAKNAATFIASIIRLAPVVLFSAAIPHQKGIGHQNEQWPQYWKELFAKNGYVAIDCFRKKIWNNKKVFPWYAQNIVVFVEKDYLNSNQKLKKEFDTGQDVFLPLVHPAIYLSKVDMKLMIIQMLPPLIRKRLKKIKFYFECLLKK